MEEIIVGNVEQLFECVKGKDTYIYGAKSIAQRVCKCLENFFFFWVRSKRTWLFSI